MIYETCEVFAVVKFKRDVRMLSSEKLIKLLVGAMNTMLKFAKFV